MIAVVFQDGCVMTLATRQSRDEQIEEAREVVKGANKGVKAGKPLAYIANVEVEIIGPVLCD